LQRYSHFYIVILKENIVRTDNRIYNQTKCK